MCTQKHRDEFIRCGGGVDDDMVAFCIGKTFFIVVALVLCAAAADASKYIVI